MFPNELEFYNYKILWEKYAFNTQKTQFSYDSMISIKMSFDSYGQPQEVKYSDHCKYWIRKV